MANYAVLNKDNIVVNVIYFRNEDITDANGNESDKKAEDIFKFIRNKFSEDELRLVKTSYNSNIRANYASIGSKYDEERDIFIPPKPNDTFTFNEETCNWVPINPGDYIAGDGGVGG
jgi:hypothetical protein